MNVDAFTDTGTYTHMYTQTHVCTETHAHTQTKYIEASVQSLRMPFYQKATHHLEL